MRHLVGPVAQVVIAGILASAGCNPGGTTKTTEDKPPSKNGPQASIPETTQECGAVDFSIPHEFQFKVANTGDEPLHLAVIKKSCLCADVRLPEDIAPDKEGTVTLIWTPIPGAPPGSETITCDLATNDPQKPNIRLEIKGMIDPLVRFYPEDVNIIDFDQLEQGQPSTREIKVFSTKLSDFKLTAKLTDPRGMKVIATPLELEEHTRYGSAAPKSAYSVVVNATSDLGPGYYRADLLLTIEAKGQPTRTITLPVHAEVSNRVFSVTPSKVLFDKAKVTEEDTKKAVVQFFNPSKPRTLRIVKHQPKFLQCELREVNSKAGTWMLTVRLPANNAEAAKFQADDYFEGSIVLQASDSPVEVPVRVRWKPEDKKKR
jgi:hypothetical protein